MNKQALENIYTRTSCKNYKSDKVDEKLIDEVIKAGVSSATGKNAQSPIIIKITNKKPTLDNVRVLCYFIQKENNNANIL